MNELKESEAIEHFLRALADDVKASEPELRRIIDSSNEYSEVKVKYNRDTHLPEFLLWVISQELLTLKNLFDTQQSVRIFNSIIHTLVSRKVFNRKDLEQAIRENIDSNKLILENGQKTAMAIFMLYRLGFIDERSNLSSAEMDWDPKFMMFLEFITKLVGRWAQLSKHYKIVP